MKYLLFILLLGLGFSQTELTTRVYELPRINFQGLNWFYDLTVLEITGIDLDFANIKIARVNDYYIEDDYVVIDIGSSNIAYNGNEIWTNTGLNLHDGGTPQYDTASTIGVIYDGSNNIRLDFSCSYNFKFNVL